MYGSTPVNRSSANSEAMATLACAEQAPIAGTKAVAMAVEAAAVPAAAPTRGAASVSIR